MTHRIHSWPQRWGFGMPESVRAGLLISLGACLGANARYWLGAWIQLRLPAGFPWGTVVINLSGSLAIGVIVALLAHRDPATAFPWRLLLVTGFLGAYTTFSTFSFETLELVRSGLLLRAAANVCGSVFGGVAGAWFGVAATEWFLKSRV